MTPFETARLISAVESLADASLGLALFAGAGLLAKRSIKAASYVALAAFLQVGGVVAQNSEAYLYRFTGNIWAIGQLFHVVVLFGVLGGMALAVRALPARAT